MLLSHFKFAITARNKGTGEILAVGYHQIVLIALFPCPFSVLLIALFIYYISVPTGRGCTPSWIFIHGTDIVDRGQIVLFFSLFIHWVPSLRRGLWCYFSVSYAIFWYFFSLALPGNFSADALDCLQPAVQWTQTPSPRSTPIHTNYTTTTRTQIEAPFCISCAGTTERPR